MTHTGDIDDRGAIVKRVAVPILEAPSPFNVTWAFSLEECQKAEPDFNPGCY
jgi:hypothetical protein